MNSDIVFNEIADRVLRVLRKHNAPAEWGRAEAFFLAGIVQYPDNLKEPNHQAHHAALWVQAHNVLIDAMPAIRSAVAKWFRSPTNAITLVLIRYPEAWNMKADELAHLLKRAGSRESNRRFPITTKKIYNAKERLKNSPGTHPH